jgi:FixJ family two-component response regulator
MRFNTLTPRARDVVALLIRGRRHKQIAKNLGAGVKRSSSTVAA